MFACAGPMEMLANNKREESSRVNKRQAHSACNHHGKPPRTSLDVIACLPFGRILASQWCFW
jgi:hypothetical protein